MKNKRSILCKKTLDTSEYCDLVLHGLLYFLPNVFSISSFTKKMIYIHDLPTQKLHFIALFTVVCQYVLVYLPSIFISVCVYGLYACISCSGLFYISLDSNLLIKFLYSQLCLQYNCLNLYFDFFFTLLILSYIKFHFRF